MNRWGRQDAALAELPALFPPMMVAAACIEELTGKLVPASEKQHLAALRMRSDWLIGGQVLPFNPASSVRSPKHVVKKGETPVLFAEEARGLLAGIDLSTLGGLRDRALIGVQLRAGERGSVEAGRGLLHAWEAVFSGSWKNA